MGICLEVSPVTEAVIVTVWFIWSRVPDEKVISDSPFASVSTVEALIIPPVVLNVTVAIGMGT